MNSSNLAFFCVWFSVNLNVNLKCVLTVIALSVCTLEKLNYGEINLNDI
jgi:hypothetical protein